MYFYITLGLYLQCNGGHFRQGGSLSPSHQSLGGGIIRGSFMTMIPVAKLNRKLCVFATFFCVFFYFCSPFSDLSPTVVECLRLACVIICYIACRLADQHVGLRYKVSRFNGRSS